MSIVLSVLFLFILFFAISKLGKGLKSNAESTIKQQSATRQDEGLDSGTTDLYKKSIELEDEYEEPDFQITRRQLKFIPNTPVEFQRASTEVPYLKIIDSKIHFYATIKSGVFSEFKVGYHISAGSPVGSLEWVIASGADHHFAINQVLYSPISGTIDFMERQASVGDLILVISPDQLPCKTSIQVFHSKKLNFTSWGINVGDIVTIGQWIGITSDYHDVPYFSPYSGKIMALSALGEVDASSSILTIECEIDESTEWYIGKIEQNI
jgi:hypothetical protein